MLVRGLLLGAYCVAIGYLLVDALWLTSERLGSVRRNQRALHAARVARAAGRGRRWRVWYWRARLALAVRARKRL